MNTEFSISLSRRLLAMGLALLLMPSVALAALKIDITQGNVEPLPIAVLDFAGDGTVGQDLAGVIVADLSVPACFARLTVRPLSNAILASMCARVSAIGALSMRWLW